MTKAYLEPEDVDLLEANALTRVRQDGRWVESHCLRDRLLIRLLFRCGMRVSEAVFLGVEDLDLEAGTVRVLHLKEKLRLYCQQCGVRLARSHRFCPGCAQPISEAERRIQETRKQRVIPLDTDTIALLRRYTEAGGPVQDRKTGKLLIFGITRYRARQVVVEAARRAGLGPLTLPETGKEHHVSPHRLRDAFAIHAMKVDDSGDGMRLLQEQLGHTSFNTTARYRRISGKEQKEWYDNLWKKPKGG